MSREEKGEKEQEEQMLRKSEDASSHIVSEGDSAVRKRPLSDGGGDATDSGTGSLKKQNADAPINPPPPPMVVAATVPEPSRGPLRVVSRFFFFLVIW